MAEPKCKEVTKRQLWGRKRWRKSSLANCNNEKDQYGGEHYEKIIVIATTVCTTTSHTDNGYETTTIIVSGIASNEDQGDHRDHRCCLFDYLVTCDCSNLMVWFILSVYNLYLCLEVLWLSLYIMCLYAKRPSQTFSEVRFCIGRVKSSLPIPSLVSLLTAISLSQNLRIPKVLKFSLYCGRTRLWLWSLFFYPLSFYLAPLHSKTLIIYF